MQHSKDELKHITALANAASERIQAGQQSTENRRDRRLGVTAILIAAFSAIFAAWQGFETRQSRLTFVRQADETRADAKEAAKQAQDVAREMMRIQREQGKDATEMARRSADAAIESNRLSMGALAASQAANVTVMSFDLTRDLAPGKNVEAQALLSNRGNVPAEAALVLGLLDPIRFPYLSESRTLDVYVGDTLHLEDTLSQGKSGLPIPFKGPMRIALPPGGITTQFISTEPLLNEAEVKYVKGGTEAIYVLAFVEYRNGFGKTERRGFCGVYDGRTPRTFNFCTGFRFRFDNSAFKMPPLGVNPAT